MSKLSLILSSCALSLAACAHFEIPPPQQKFLGFNTFTGLGWYGNLAPILKNQDEGHPNFASISEWHKSFCDSGKPIRNYSYHIRAIVPPAPKGVVVTEAAEQRSQWLADIQKAGPAVFMAATATPNVPPQEKSGYYRNVFAFEGDTIGAILKSIQTGTYSLQGKTHPHKAPMLMNNRQSVHDIINARAVSPMMFIKLEGDPKLYLVERQAFKLTNIQGVGYVGGTTSNDFLETAEVPRNNSSNLPDFFYVRPKFQTQVRGNGIASNTKMTLSSLSAASLGDVAIMSDDFVLLLPQSEQEKYQMRTFNSSDIARTVRDRKKIFRDMVSKLTTVKQEQSDDPDIIDYEVSLDLSLFCAYGRPVSDFISK